MTKMQQIIHERRVSIQCAVIVFIASVSFMFSVYIWWQYKSILYILACLIGVAVSYYTSKSNSTNITQRRIIRKFRKMKILSYTLIFIIFVVISVSAGFANSYDYMYLDYIGDTYGIKTANAIEIYTEHYDKLNKCCVSGDFQDINKLLLYQGKSEYIKMLVKYNNSLCDTVHSDNFQDNVIDSYNIYAPFYEDIVVSLGMYTVIWQVVTLIILLLCGYICMGWITTLNIYKHSKKVFEESED